MAATASLTQYLIQDATAGGSHFQKRVSQAIIEVAQIVQAEGTAVTNHANRGLLATSVLNYLNPQRVAAVAQAVANGGAGTPLDDTATDSQVELAVSNLWNALAGGV